MIWAPQDGAAGGSGLPARESGPDTARVADAPPPGFLALSERLPPYLDRSLGYVGDDRFVIFYYEPRGEEGLRRFFFALRSRTDVGDAVQMASGVSPAAFGQAFAGYVKDRFGAR